MSKVIVLAHWHGLQNVRSFRKIWFSKVRSAGVVKVSRVKRARDKFFRVSAQSHSPFSASLQTFGVFDHAKIRTVLQCNYQ